MYYLQLPLYPRYCIIFIIVSVSYIEEENHA